MSRDTGGPAFPVQGQPMPGGEPGDLIGQLFHGMTLRDYFAAAALNCLRISGAKEWMSYNESGIAAAAYELADAMLAERAKT